MTVAEDTFLKTLSLSKDLNNDSPKHITLSIPGLWSAGTIDQKKAQSHSEINELLIVNCLQQAFTCIL